MSSYSNRKCSFLVRFFKCFKNKHFNKTKSNSTLVLKKKMFILYESLKPPVFRTLNWKAWVGGGVHAHFFSSFGLCSLAPTSPERPS